jgi:hypothetical protein
MIEASFCVVCLCLFAALVTAGIAQESSAASATVYSDPRCPRSQFAAAELTSALAARGIRAAGRPLDAFPRRGAETCFVLISRSDIRAHTRVNPPGATDAALLKPEGYVIRVDGNTHWIIGADAAGVMYGGLEAAEAILTRGGLADVACNPHMPLRGTKFNIPLDARTPSYTDVSDSAQKNIAEMWSMDFWRGYIDNLARARYNFISLWSLHPFPSLVKLDKYPDIALDDVKRSRVKWRELYSLNGTGFDAPEILDNLETLKRISIDQKIAFWRDVMAYAKSRNITFCIVTWNIFTNGTYGKYGITDRFDNATTTDYFRRSVKQLLLTYPDLGGVGLTTGENMHRLSTVQKERWAFDTYGRGVLDAAAEQPGRKILFIHRQHQTGAGGVLEQFEPLIRHKNIDFIFSFKYAKAHVYSATRQPYHEGFVRDIRERGVKTMWTMRNDDVYFLRWGAPDFVRDFLRNVPHDVSAGFYLGSDQYVWGREFSSLRPKSPRELEVEKHWYHWMIWGRLGYDPDLANDAFVAILQRRFPNVHAKKLFEAWQSASMIYPTVTGFHWGALDFHWWIEGCKGNPSKNKRRAGMRPTTESGFHGVEDFMRFEEHKYSGFMSIDDYVDAGCRSDGGKTPYEVADMVDGYSDAATALVRQLDPRGDRDLKDTLDDIRTMAAMGRYYAAKIRGSTHLAVYRKRSDRKHQREAVSELTRALEHWKAYAKLMTGRYRSPVWMNRVGYVDWHKLTRDAERDVAIARGE